MENWRTMMIHFLWSYGDGINPKKGLPERQSFFETGNGNFHYRTIAVFCASGTGSGVF